jgi:hypothetical protein
MGLCCHPFETVGVVELVGCFFHKDGGSDVQRDTSLRPADEKRTGLRKCRLIPKIKRGSMGILPPRL